MANSSNQSKSSIILISSAVLLVLGLLVAVIFWLKPTQTSIKPSSQATTTPITNNNAPVVASAPHTNAQQSDISLATKLPKSLQGTKVDGEIVIDEQKQLVVTTGLKNLFDYFLSTQGEESLAVIEQSTIDYIQKRTPEPAASQAIKIYRNYLAYLKAVSSIDKELSKYTSDNSQQIDISLIKQQQSRIQALRNQYFDAATIKAFFGAEDALNTYTLATLEANQNPNLTETQRQQIEQNAKQQYIASIADKQLQAKLQQQDNIATLLSETEKLRKQGASQDEINALRRQYVNEDAVQRLSQLDAQEADFAKRVAEFGQVRQQILTTSGNTPEAQRQIVETQNRLFSPQERLRLGSYVIN